MMHHSAVSLDYLEERIVTDPSPNWLAEDGPPLTLLEQREIIDRWRELGHLYAPPCDNVTPDGRCAGHEKE